MAVPAGGGGARQAFVLPGVECFELGPGTFLLRSRSRLAHVSGPVNYRVVRHLLDPAAELTGTGPAAWPAADTVLERLTAAGMLGWAAPGGAGVPRRLMVPHVQGIKMTDPLGLFEASAGQETRAGAPDVTVLATDSYLRVPRLVSQDPPDGPWAILLIQHDRLWLSPTMGADRGLCLRCFLAAVSRHDDLLALFLAAGIEPVPRVRSPAPPVSLPSRLRGRLAAILAAQAGRRPAESSGHRLTQIPLDGAEPTAHVVPAQAACGCSPRPARAGGGRLPGGPSASHCPLPLYDEVRARLGPMLDPVTGLVSTPRAAPADASSAVFVALADYADPTRGLHSHLAWARSGPIRVVRSGGRSRTGFGAGWDIGEARAKAVLEAYERLLTLAWPDEPPLPAAAPADLDAPAYWIGALAGGREDGGGRGWHHSLEDGVTAGPVVGWVPARTLAGQPCYVPHAHCRRLPAGHPDLQLIDYEPSGSAVAFTRPDAIFAGFLEVVERDAASIWWQARLAVPAVDLSTVDDARVQLFLEDQRSLGRQVWMLDITSGVGIPVFVLFVQEAGQPPVFGMACHASKHQAARSAALEAGQALRYAEQERRKWPLPRAGAEFWKPHWGHTAWDAIPDADPGGSGAASCQRLADRTGLTLAVHDLPLLCEGLAGVKVIVPGLCGLTQPARCTRVREEASRRGARSELLATGQYNPDPFPA
jgi:ribosomal protein S12 methylthiotransferase accessory factor YcaO